MIGDPYVCLSKFQIICCYGTYHGSLAKGKIGKY